MRGTIFGLLLFLLVGCAALDRAFTPTNGDAPIVEAVKSAKPLIPAPWGEVSLAAVILAQNIYLAIRKVQQKKAQKNG